MKKFTVIFWKETEHSDLGDGFFVGKIFNAESAASARKLAEQFADSLADDQHPIAILSIQESSSVGR